MKKFLSLMLALMMMLFSVSALADAKTVTIQANIDKDQLATVAPMFNIPSDAQGAVDAIVALVNGLCIKIVATDNAGEIDIDLAAGDHLVAIGGGLDGNNIVVGSDLLPSYLFSLSEEFIQQMMQQIMAKLPNGGQGLDIEALMQTLTQYVGKFVASAQAAIIPGTPETVAYEVEGYTFDTKTPTDVDVMALAEALKTLVSDVLHDETIAQVLQALGQNVDPDQVVSQMEAGMDPETAPAVKVDVYSSTADSSISYVFGQIFPKKDSETPVANFSVLGTGNGAKAMLDLLEQGVRINADVGADHFRIQAEGNGAFMALEAKIGASGAQIAFYLMNQTKALLTLNVSVADGGEMTLNLDPASKTVISIEDIQANKVDQTVVQGLRQELMSGIFPLVTKLMQAVPEASPLLQQLMSGGLGM